jgi:hypothetical protein
MREKSNLFGQNQPAGNQAKRIKSKKNIACKLVRRNIGEKITKRDVLAESIKPVPQKHFKEIQSYRRNVNLVAQHINQNKETNPIAIITCSEKQPAQIQHKKIITANLFRSIVYEQQFMHT